ncbi:MAG: HEAT repeat domain-containing protein [Bdellovibrionales bacterium]|nr:HEAT repeat domain-containing protein [Bdellovibrionales bacterium]
MKRAFVFAMIFLSFGKALAAPALGAFEPTMSSILVGLSEKRSDRQYEAAERLLESTDPAALSLAEFIILQETKVPGYPISTQGLNGSLRNHLQHITRDVLIHNYGRFADFPGFTDSFIRVYSAIQSPFPLRKMVGSLQNCDRPHCLELFKLAIKSKDSMVRAAAYKMLVNFDFKDKNIQSMIKAGLSSVHHAEKAEATFALLGRTEKEIVPLAESSLRSLYVVTRLYAISALGKIKDPSVFAVYKEGLKDADSLVRYHTIFELGRRPEPEAKQLLELVSAQYPDLKPRTAVQQEALVPQKERWAEKVRDFKDSFNWMNSYAAGSLGIGMAEAFTTSLRRPKDWISRWQYSNRTEADLAQAFLEKNFFSQEMRSFDLTQESFIETFHRVSYEGAKCSAVFSLRK